MSEEYDVVDHRGHYVGRVFLSRHPHRSRIGIVVVLGIVVVAALAIVYFKGVPHLAGVGHSDRTLVHATEFGILQASR